MILPKTSCGNIIRKNINLLIIKCVYSLKANTEESMKAIQGWLLKTALVVALVAFSGPISPSLHFISASPATELRIFHGAKAKRAAFYRSFVATPDPSLCQIINVARKLLYTLLAYDRVAQVKLRTTPSAPPLPGAFDQSLQLIHSRAKSQDPDLIHSRG